MNCGRDIVINPVSTSEIGLTNNVELHTGVKKMGVA